MKATDRYLKIVEWSEEDSCYIGTCPGVIYGGVHGDDETKVYEVPKRFSAVRSVKAPRPECAAS